MIYFPLFSQHVSKTNKQKGKKSFNELLRNKNENAQSIKGTSFVLPAPAGLEGTATIVTTGNIGLCPSHSKSRALNGITRQNGGPSGKVGSGFHGLQKLGSTPRAVLTMERAAPPASQRLCSGGNHRCLPPHPSIHTSLSIANRGL